MTKPITATIESKVNDPSMFEIWFRVDGALVGRGLITFNDKPTAERFLSSMLNPEQFDVEASVKELADQLGIVVEDHKSFITTTKGSNWFAVQYWWNPEMGGFWEPWETGIGRYSTEDRAIEEAQDWANAEGLEYRPRSTT